MGETSFFSFVENENFVNKCSVVTYTSRFTQPSFAYFRMFLSNIITTSIRIPHAKVPYYGADKNEIENLTAQTGPK